MKEAFEKIKERLEELFCGEYDTEYIKKDSVLSIVSEAEAEYGNGWIPCSERLPEKSGRYLVCIDGVAWIADFFNSTWFGKRYRYSNVIAWMPLPTPYKEGDHV